MKKQTKRLFLATFITESRFLDNYNDIINDFKLTVKGKWVEENNLHFTYQFLGDTDEKLIPDISNELKDYLTEWQDELIIIGLNSFPNINKPRILFANIENSSGLIAKNYLQMNKLLKKFDYKPEDRKYTPHVTLIRINEFKNPNFQSIIQKYRNTEFDILYNYRISLVESQLTPKGAIYSEIKLK